jgi:hypothetical protein
VDNELTRIGKNLFYLPEIRPQTQKTTKDLRTVGAQAEIKTLHYPKRGQKFIAGSMFIGTAGTD